jgi:hypothetical protein
MVSYIYRNLRVRLPRVAWQYGDAPRAPHKGSDGKPIQHTQVIARNVSFKLPSDDTWRRCLNQARDATTDKSWEVIAYAVGDVLTALPASALSLPRVQITYDKLNQNAFVRKDTRSRISHCEFVVFHSDGHCYALGEIK